MKILLSWLKDYVDVNVSPECLAEKLVSAGFEIEEIIYEKETVKNVVVCEVLKVEKHPNADKLNVLEVNVGDAEKQVVTNDKTIKAGDKVALALDGAVLANGMEIKAGELRGVHSDGMFCGLEELGLERDEYPAENLDGVLVLKNTAKVGGDITEEIGKTDVILDVSITANRADCNSLVGIAREVSAVLGVPMRPIPLEAKAVRRMPDFRGVTIKEPELCPRYIAAEVSDIKICESPEIIKSRLRKVGIRPINNIVDITNYVLIEIGQPMHAFDFNLLEGGEIIVRKAENGEKMVALDGKEYALNDSNLIICDKKGAVAIAGVMGGEFSGINENTKTVIFESARFARDSVRLTSRALNLRSDSSQRYEKGVDYYCQFTGLHRALNIIDKYGYGQIVGQVFDSNPDVSEKTVVCTTDDIEYILGIRVPDAEIERILNSLCIKTTVKDGVITSQIPLFREDIVGKNDIAEEIIRIYGYDHLTPTLLKEATSVNGGRTSAQKAELKLKDYLAGLGLHEILTYSFVTPKMFDILQIPSDSPLRTAITIENPLGEDFSVMRTTLVYSMLKTLELNYKRGNKAGRYFEISKRYLPKELPLNGWPTEKSTLCVGLIGDREDFYSAKEIVENLFEKMEIPVEFKRGTREFLHPTRTAVVVSNGTEIGYLGEVHPKVSEKFGLDKRVYLAEIDAEFIFSKDAGVPEFITFSKFQSVERDLAVLADKTVEASAIIDAVKAADNGIIENVSIFDIYEGGQVEAGKKSVALKLVLRDKSKTLTDDAINAQVEAVLASLLEKTGAALRL